MCSAIDGDDRRNLALGNELRGRFIDLKLMLPMKRSAFIERVLAFEHIEGGIFRLVVKRIRIFGR